MKFKNMILTASLSVLMINSIDKISFADYEEEKAMANSIANIFFYPNGIGEEENINEDSDIFIDGKKKLQPKNGIIQLNTNKSLWDNTASDLKLDNYDDYESDGEEFKIDLNFE